MARYLVSRSAEGVWMSDDESVSRKVAIDAMVAMGLNPDDFWIRDRLIMAISDRIDGSLDAVCETLRGRIETGEERHIYGTFTD